MTSRPCGRPPRPPPLPGRAGAPSASAPGDADGHDHQTSSTITNTEMRKSMTNSRIEIDGYASGMDERALRAAWTILVNACDGRLLEGPWIDRSGERLRYIYDADDSAAAVLSTSDRSVLLVVHSLMDDERTVALGEDLGLIEQEDLKVVLSALTWFLEEDVEPLLVVDEHDPSASASGPAAAPSASASGATGDADEQAEQTTDPEARSL